MVKRKELYSIILLLVLLLSIVALPGCGDKTNTNAQDIYEKAIATANTKISEDINSGKAGSASVAIIDNGKIVYSECFGMADREDSIPVDSYTIFNIGSISKIYCATSIMLLVDDGKVSLDSPVTQYLPEFVMADDRYKDITVRMLLNHTSGLPGSSYANSFGFEYNADIFKDTLENLARSHLKYAPGEMAVYCNDGFTLGEMIVERVSGQKYINFLSENIFKPLSLTKTGLSVGEQTGKTAAAYYDAKTGKKEPLEVVSILGAGGLSSTPDDLCRFASTFSKKGNRLFSKTSLEEMLKAQPASFYGKLRNSDVTFGLGWDMTDFPEY